MREEQEEVEETRAHPGNHKGRRSKPASRKRTAGRASPASTRTVARSASDKPINQQRHQQDPGGRGKQGHMSDPKIKPAAAADLDAEKGEFVP